MKNAARFQRLTFGILFVLAWLCPKPCHADPRQGRIVLVETSGAEAWPIVEKRITAELLAIGKQVIAIRAATETDRSLPRYAARFGATIVLQVIRVNEEGIVRLWLTGTPRTDGAFRHIVVDLRGAEVVSDVALATVELVVSREQALSQELPTPVFGAGPEYSAFAGGAVLFAGGGVRGAVGLVAGMHGSFDPHLALELEALWAAHQPGRTAEDFEFSAWGARGLLTYTPWLAVPLRLTLGVGGGYVAVPHRLSISSAAARTPLLCVRNQFSVPISPWLDATFRLTWSHGIHPVILQREDGVQRAAFDVALDAVIGLQVALF